MDVWKCLGIEPTKDLKAIKKAYANMSKKYHPEEHPEEFKLIQKAYKEAVRFAKGEQEEIEPEEPIKILKQEQPVKIESEYRKEYKTENRYEQENKYDSENKYEQKLEEVIGNKRSQMDNPNTSFYSYDEIPPVFHFHDSYEECFFRELDYMLWHPYMRHCVVYWRCFLQQEKYANLMQDKEFRDKFLERLRQENYFFHYEVRDYFVQLWKQYTDDDIKSLLIEDRILTWKRDCYTDDEKDIYDKIWNRRKDPEGKTAENYLKEYFRYAELNAEKLLAVYREANSARVLNKEKRVSIFKTILYILFVAFLLLFAVRGIGLIIFFGSFLWSKISKKK